MERIDSGVDDYRLRDAAPRSAFHCAAVGARLLACVQGHDPLIVMPGGERVVEVDERLQESLPKAGDCFLLLRARKSADLPVNAESANPQLRCRCVNSEPADFFAVRASACIVRPWKHQDLHSPAARTETSLNSVCR